MSSGSLAHGRTERRRTPPAGRRAGPRAGRRLPALVALVAIVVVGWTGWSGIARGLERAESRSPFDGPPPSCRIDDLLTPHRTPADWDRTLLDPEYRLAPDDRPPDLVRLADVGIDGRGWIRAIVVEDLRAMAAAARAAGTPFRITSAYRSHEHQERTFASLESSLGRDEALRSAARPGHSEHQLGTTVDVDGGEAFLAANAARYGFVMSYPPEHSPAATCYKPEPWHFRYFGRVRAMEIVASGESVRSWLWERQSGG